MADDRAGKGQPSHPRLSTCRPEAGSLREAVATADACFNLSIDDTGLDLIGPLAARSGRRIPIVYASSAAVYGLQPPGTPISETAGLHTTTSYGRVKIAIEEKAGRLGRETGLATVGLRLFNVYAETQDARTRFASVVTRYVDALRSGRPIMLMGDGAQMRDFIHVEDVVEAMVSSASLASTEAPVFNCCTGTGTTIRDLVHRLERLLGLEAPIEHAPAPKDDVAFSVGDGRRLRRATGFTARIPLAEGLRRYIDPDNPKRRMAVVQVA